MTNISCEGLYNLTHRINYNHILCLLTLISLLSLSACSLKDKDCVNADNAQLLLSGITYTMHKLRQEDNGYLALSLPVSGVTFTTSYWGGEFHIDISDTNMLRDYYITEQGTGVIEHHFETIKGEQVLYREYGDGVVDMQLHIAKPLAVVNLNGIPTTALPCE